jgi:hypothetical protein
LQGQEDLGNVSRFLDTEEVSGSNPLSPTLRRPANQDKTKVPGLFGSVRD